MVVRKDDVTKTWYVRVSYKDSVSGRYNKKSKFGFKRKKDAEEWEAKIKLDLKKGLDIGSNPLFPDYFDKWIETYKSVPNVSARTYDSYLTTKSHVDKHFKDVKIRSITKMAYQEFLNKLAKVNTKSTNQKMHKHIRACIKDAIDSGIISKDLTYKVSVSGLKGQQEDDKFLSEKEIKSLMNEIRNGITFNMTTRWMAILQFAGGLRYSEVAGLRFQDFGNNTLNIHNAWDFKTNQLGPTKNGVKRTIRIEPTVFKEINSYILKKKEDNLKKGIKNDLLFTTYNGTPPSHTAMNKSLKRSCTRAEIKKITSHALRHTHVSLLIYRGMDIISISKRIGHSSATTTIEEYSHVINELDHKNDKISDQMIGSIM